MENDKKKTLPPELVKLSERVAKDPSSKLFLPLAEEYMNLGMLVEAEAVLLDGIQNHPTYLSARVLLGTVLLQKGERSRALAEFQEVVVANPDNLLANKKIAEIHITEGRPDDALRSCEAVLAVNPRDADMMTLREDLLETRGRRETEDSMDASPARPSVSTDSVEEFPIEDEAKRAYMPVETQRYSEAEEEAVAASRVEETRESTAESSAVEDKVLDDTSEGDGTPVVLLPDDDTDMKAVLGEFEEEKPPEDLTARSSSIGQEDGSMETVEREFPTRVLDDSIGDGDSVLEGGHSPESEDRSAYSVEEVAAGPADTLATEALAELYIKQGYYDKGIEIYRKILEQDSRRGGIRQKLDDAITLSNLIGPQSSAHDEFQSEESDKNFDNETADMLAEPREADASATGIKEREASPREQKIRKLEAWLERIHARSNENEF